MKERAQGIRTARTRLEQALGREPTLSELAAETGLEPEEIAAAETATGPTESLQKENGETGFTLEHTLGDYEQEDAHGRICRPARGAAPACRSGSGR